MSILQHFLDDLCATPEDWALRGVVADWAEDNDQPRLAEALRWMIRHQKRPYLDSTGTGTWFNAETVSPGLGDPEADIPEEVYTHLDGGKKTANHKKFPSMREAEESFLRAWAKARAEGWTSPD